MKRKSLFLNLKKFTIASLRTHSIVGAGQTTDRVNCPGDPSSDTSSNTDPLSNVRNGCASGGPGKQ